MLLLIKINDSIQENTETCGQFCPKPNTATRCQMRIIFKLFKCFKGSNHFKWLHSDVGKRGFGVRWIKKFTEKRARNRKILKLPSKMRGRICKTTGTRLSCPHDSRGSLSDNITVEYNIHYIPYLGLELKNLVIRYQWFSVVISVCSLISTMITHRYNICYHQNEGHRPLVVPVSLDKYWI